MEIFPTIEALIQYAGAHLLLDELDYVYARNRILDLLKLSDYEEYEINEEEIEAMQTPDDILNALCAFAVNQKLIAETDKPMFAKRLMDCVIKRPGEIADTFANLPIAKAFEWLYDYGIKSGQIKIPARKWDAKGTKGKLEIVFNGCNSCGGDCKKETEYPQCKKCRDNEGYGKNLNMRSIPVDLYGERMFFYYKKRPVAQNQGVIVSEYHRDMTLNKTSINKMFDFAVKMPGWYVAARESAHENYSTFSKPLPFNKAPDLNRFKSKEYPYINITTIDWYIGAVRLNCTNREKLIEYTEVLINKWRAAEENNTAAVCVRKTTDSYAVELMLFNADKKPAEQYGNLNDFTSVTSLMGVYPLNNKQEEQLKQMEKYLTKQEKYNPAKLDPDMAVNSAMISRLMQNLGSGKVTELEAALDVKDEVCGTLENALISLNSPIDILYGNF